MRMKQCGNGHFYDGEKHVECPYCQTLQSENAAVHSSEVTIGIESMDAVPFRDGRTVAILHRQTGVDPVVGWLVCVDGPDKGKDYRLHSDNNFIGRDERMDVVICGDDAISRLNHARLTYDAQTGKYFFAQEEGRSIARVNGQVVMCAVELQAYDVIETGITKLMFIPLCGERFQWT